ncbi:hypothetical protein N0V82_007964 [Gnomoniopsis sp. IMI 355080]|nr:hypothetical protein N0V82_007964 [Gnomoniopsis sp. IMI 355080]
MGIIVKILGGGLGMASEAIHDYRARSRQQSGQSPAPYSTVPSSSTSRAIDSPNYDAPPEYVEVSDEATAEKMIRNGQAERVVDYTNDKQDYNSNIAEDTDEYGDSSSDDDSITEEDEAAWELDEMAKCVGPPSYTEARPIPAAGSAEGESEGEISKKEDDAIHELVRMAGPPPQPMQRLPCTVIIPQRRPRNKDRGFVRAYAPVMEGCGVAQDVFLKFQEDWLTASKSDPWIDIVFVAAGIAGFAPSVIATIVSSVVQVVAGTAKELQSRHRRNTFLDRANQELFMPRGMYAMVMAFKDEVPGQQPRGPLSKLAGTLGKSLFSTERLDINQTAAKYSNPDPEMSRLKKGMKDIRLVSGKTYTEVELPEAAALVYPDLDRAVEKEMQQEGKTKKTSTKDKFKGAGAWVQDYMDRKAQATFEKEHQGSSLAVPSSSRKEFSSRFSDPNHPANSGSLLSLVTGGTINTGSKQEKRALRQDRRALKREQKNQRRMARGRAPRGPRRGRRQKGQRKGVIKRIMQKDVLYLLIINLPTEQEVQQSVASLERITATRD